MCALTLVSRDCLGFVSSRVNWGVGWLNLESFPWKAQRPQFPWTQSKGHSLDSLCQAQTAHKGTKETPRGCTCIQTHPAGLFQSPVMSMLIPLTLGEHSQKTTSRMCCIINLSLTSYNFSNPKASFSARLRAQHFQDHTALCCPEPILQGQ